MVVSRSAGFHRCVQPRNHLQNKDRQESMTLKIPLRSFGVTPFPPPHPSPWQRPISLPLAFSYRLLSLASSTQCNALKLISAIVCVSN